MRSALICSAALNPDARPFVKIRFLTWNMHESLPKGDLTPLLGPVPAYVPPTQAEIDSGLLPQLPLLLEGSQQPPTYHMVVVSGQETPTPSGIPLGLAAVKWGAGHSHTSTPSIATHATSPFAAAGLASGQQTPQSLSSHQQQQLQPASPQAAPPVRSTAPPHPSPLGGTQAKASADGGLHPPAFSLSPASPPPTAVSTPRNAAAAPSPTPSSATPAPLTTATSAGGGQSLKSNLSLQIPGSGASGASSAGSSGATSKTGSPTASGRTTAAGSSGHSAADVGLPDSEPRTGPSMAAADGFDGVRPDAAQVAGTGKTSQPRMSEPKGWSELLEDWFCNRAGEPVPQRSAAPTTAPVSPEASDAEDDGPGARLAVPPEPAVQSGGRSSKSARIVEEGLGAYQLVRKERMLGIYLAVFVWKGASHLLEATSSSYVTTGLIGGRWGNKGGVAISVKLASKRLLFINSHLSVLPFPARLSFHAAKSSPSLALRRAAHASRSDVRLLNVAKIKSELSIDAFLDSGDHRTLLEGTSHAPSRWKIASMLTRPPVTQTRPTASTRPSGVAISTTGEPLRGLFFYFPRISPY
jgi:hypothetical protein